MVIKVNHRAIDDNLPSRNSIANSQRLNDFGQRVYCHLIPPVSNRSFGLNPNSLRADKL